MKQLIDVLNKIYATTANFEVVNQINIRSINKNITELATALASGLPDEEKDVLRLEKILNEAERKFLETYRKDYSVTEYEYRFGGE